MFGSSSHAIYSIIWTRTKERKGRGRGRGEYKERCDRSPNDSRSSSPKTQSLVTFFNRYSASAENGKRKGGRRRRRRPKPKDAFGMRKGRPLFLAQRDHVQERKEKKEEKKKERGGKKGKGRVLAWQDAQLVQKFRNDKLSTFKTRVLVDGRGARRRKEKEEGKIEMR